MLTSQWSQILEIKYLSVYKTHPTKPNVLTERPSSVSQGPWVLYLHSLLTTILIFMITKIESSILKNEGVTLKTRMIRIIKQQQIAS